MSIILNVINLLSLMGLRQIGQQFFMTFVPFTHCSRQASWNICPHTNFGTDSPCIVSSIQIEQYTAPSTLNVPRHKGPTVSRPSRVVNSSSVISTVAIKNQKSVAVHLNVIDSHVRLPVPIYEKSSSLDMAPAKNVHFKTCINSFSVIVV